MSTQYPTAQLEVGGQATVSGYDVLSHQESMVEDSEDYKKADGTHRCEIVYSRRTQHTLELQALSGTDSSSMVKGGNITINGNTCKMKSADLSKTRGPQVLNVVAINEAEELT